MKNFILTGRDDVKITGYEWNVENPEKIVCIIHGIGEYAKRFEEVADIFNRNKIAVFALDLRGHGKTDGVRGHTAPRNMVLEDVDKLILYAMEKYPDIKICLYGHSMGGNIVLDYRNRGNLNGELAGYVVTSPWITLQKKVGKLQYWGIKLLAKAMPKHQIKSKIDPAALGRMDKVKKYENDQYMHGAITAQCALESFEIARDMYYDNHEKKGAGRDKPMLLMHGDKDEICHVAGSRKIAKNQEDTCDYVEWKNMLHELHNGNEESDGTQVVEQAVEFVKSL